MNGLALPFKTSRRAAFLLSGLLLAGLGCLSLFAYQRSTRQFDRQMATKILPLTADAVTARIDDVVGQPVLASKLLADNSLLVDLLSSGDSDPGAITSYLSSIKQVTGAQAAFLVQQKTLRYFHSSGLIQNIQPDLPRDRWYQDFLDSGQMVEIHVNRDAAHSEQTIAFVNVRIQGRDQTLLGVAGLGVSADAIARQLKAIQSDYGARIFLVNGQGDVILSSDGTEGAFIDVPGIGDQARVLMSQSSSAMQRQLDGDMLYVNAQRIRGSGLMLVVVQTLDPDEKQMRSLLIQNTVAALLIGASLIVAGRFTIGREQEKLHQAAHTDGLTGLLNRTAFAPLFDTCTADAVAGQGGLVAALMDIDYFKRVNDTYGHAVGDEALRIVATAIRSSVRDTDPVFRWGGEEFLLLLPMADLPQALARLEALRDRLRGTPIEVPQPVGAIYVTLSFGVARHRKGESSAGLLQRADRALYEAKNSGRDCIVVDQES